MPLCCYACLACIAGVEAFGSLRRPHNVPLNAADLVVTYSNDPLNTIAAPSHTSRLGEGGALNTSRLISSDETRYTVMLSVAVMLEVRAISDSTPYLHKYDVATFETSTSALGSGTGSASVLPLAVTTDTIVDEG